MSTPLCSFANGSFTSTGTSFVLPLEFSPTYFRLLNQTDQNSVANPGVVKKAEWFSGMAADTAFVVTNTAGAATDQSSLLASGGITLVNTSVQIPGPLNSTITAISAANPAVVSTTSTAGVVNGGVVSIINETNMQQISGWQFTVSSVVANTSFNLAYLDSSTFGAAGTTGSFRVIPYNPLYYPATRLITKITTGTTTQVQMSVTNPYTVGQLVRILVPAFFGMTQINGQLGTVTAVNAGTNTITLNINSTGYTPFAFPVSAIAAAGVNFPQVIPVGEAATAPYQNLLDDATFNQSVVGLNLGSGVVGANNDVLFWIAASGVSL